MKISKEQLRQIIIEEMSGLAEMYDKDLFGDEGQDPAESAKYRGNPNKPWDEFFPPSEEEEEYTPMMPPKEATVVTTLGSIINGLKSGELSPEGAADRLESEVKAQLSKMSGL